ncbi:hypothetical protein SAMN05216559_3989 [Halomicrobium zhouii]|uniref:DUF8052 domain-containing protein n=1 Tax=Halomicrobium zhouii TaxID=767519 RepID=A0A1I6M8I1_9EURY|nr:hypothetical protein [Halomicrobium zhouii]SFS11989.1 hypothetical protein SAMN05216559_3989 [Halomicrobium zhouii]
MSAAGDSDEPGEPEDAEESADGASARDENEPDVPDWEDEYFDRVSDRLFHNYDLAKDHRVEAGESGAGERFDLYGRLAMTSQKHFVHPNLTYGHHERTEHLYARRTESVTVADLERLVELGHDLADKTVEPSEEHFSTDFTFAVVAPKVPDDVRSFVAGFSDRTLIKYGYHGHYEVNLVVVAPERENIVASESADIARAFALWESDEEGDSSSGLLSRLLP